MDTQHRRNLSKFIVMSVHRKVEGRWREIKHGHLGYQHSLLYGVKHVDIQATTIVEVDLKFPTTELNEIPINDKISQTI